MTVTFFSNYLNDHQLPFCEAMISQIGENNFHFVAHECIDSERTAIGFLDMNEVYPFVVKAFEGGEAQRFAEELMLNSDIVIVGSCINMPIHQRIKANKITFRYNERFLKKGDFYWFDPRIQRGMYLNFGRYRSQTKPLYELCASAYTARDLSLFGFPKSKCFKWGYFPQLKQYTNIDKLIEQKREKSILRHPDNVSILWVARLIEWKHPEYPIEIAKRLKDDGYKFSLDMIGIGCMKDKVQQLIDKYGLQDCVRLLGGMPPSEVRRYMEQSEIFLFTSDKNEGWGAVLNESLNSACAVVANKAIGSVPFLLDHEINGLMYDESVYDAYCQVKKLMDNSTMRRELGVKGYYTITETWNAVNATKCLLQLFQYLQNDEDFRIVSGPCSNID